MNETLKKFARAGGVAGTLREWRRGSVTWGMAEYLFGLLGIDDAGVERLRKLGRDADDESVYLAARSAVFATEPE